MADKRKVRVKKSEKDPETTEILAAAIVNISKSFTALSKSGLNRRAIKVLIRDHCGVNLSDIESVLYSLERLAGYYCKK